MAENETFVINAAILHVFDFSSGITVYSNRTLNLEDKLIEKYIKGHVRKAMRDMRMKDGTFLEESLFLEEMRAFQSGSVSFLDTAREISERIEEPLKKDSLQSYDILEVSYQMEEVPYFGLFLLENTKAFTHATSVDMSGISVNQITLQASILPSPSKRLNRFAIIQLLSMDVMFVEEEKEEGMRLLQDTILQCTSTRSKEEILQEVTDVVTEVAEKCDENPTLLLSEYKNYLKQNAEESDTITTQDLAVHVFAKTPKMQDTFLSASLEHEIPQEVRVPQAAVRTAMKNQKIKTDTGIELIFPTEYFQNPELIEFINHPDGTISIEIKKVGKITNRGK